MTCCSWAVAFQKPTDFIYKSLIQLDVLLVYTDVCITIIYQSKGEAAKKAVACHPGWGARYCSDNTKKREEGVGVWVKCLF